MPWFVGTYFDIKLIANSQFALTGPLLSSSVPMFCCGELTFLQGPNNHLTPVYMNSVISVFTVFVLILSDNKKIILLSRRPLSDLCGYSSLNKRVSLAGCLSTTTTTTTTITSVDLSQVMVTPVGCVREACATCSWVAPRLIPRPRTTAPGSRDLSPASGSRRNAYSSEPTW